MFVTDTVPFPSRFFVVAFSALMLLAGVPTAAAQATDRVLAPVNPREVLALSGHHPAWASPKADAGAVPGDLRLQHVTLLLARSPQAQQALDQFLQNQQDPASADYHHWLTSVEFGQRFGVSPHDLAAVTQWLQSQNLQVDSVSESRVRITFSGSATAVAGAFGAEMHYFNVNGEKRISVTAEPQIPAALAPVIQSVHGLYTLINRPMHHISAQPGRMATSSSGNTSPQLTFNDGSHAVMPGDFAIIYNVNPAYNASIFGFGQTIAIIGRSRVNNADIEEFQALTELPIQDPGTIIPPGALDPGPAQTAPPVAGNPSEDQAEATLDVTRSGSIAPGARVALIVSAPTATIDGIDIAMQYAVDANPVPAHIMSISFGSCESTAGPSAVHYFDSLFSQGAAEGISIFVSSGDAGAAGCDVAFQTPPASQTLSPNVICSSSYATCVGGTEFADFASPSTYWGNTNAANGTSVLCPPCYIPEGAWNEPLNSLSALQVAGTGGGVSSVIATPPWQTGTGVPAARAGRYTPDVAFSASAHDGYFACLANFPNSDCAAGGHTIFSGTSAAAPDMAGITALLAQQQGILGNLNPTLYRLAATPVNGVFNDVTALSSGVSGCTINVPSMCNNSTPSPGGLMGGLAGYLVTAGFDEATGWGSINVGNLLNSWSSVSALATTSATLTSNINPAPLNTAVKFTATISPTTGPTPTGSVNFMDSGVLLGSGVLTAGVASFTTSALTAGSHTITAAYGGDGNNAGSLSAPLTETITSSYPAPTLLSMSPSSATAGGGSFVLTLQGSNFYPTSTIQWNGSSAGLTTTYVNGSELQTTIPLADLAAAGTAAVTVSNPAPGGGASSPLIFSVLELFSGSGGFLSMFVNGSNVGNSILFQGNCPATGQPCIGIGNTAPIRTLDVSGEIQARGGNLFLQRNLTDSPNRRNWAWGTETANYGDMAFFVSTSNTNFPSVNVMTLLSNGNVGIGPVATTPATTLQVGGDIRMGTTGTNGCLQNFAGTALAGTCSSDLRLKTNILPFAPVLNKLVLLEPVHFDWNREQYPDYHFGPGRNSGLLAQDVEKVFPDLVSIDAHGYKAVNYSELPYLTLAAIRELKTENDALRAQLAAMEARLARLEKPPSRRTTKKPATGRTRRVPAAKPQS